MLVTLFIFAVAISYVLGQFARVQFDNGISALLLDLIVGVFAFVSFVHLLLAGKLKTITGVTLFRPFAFFVGACVVSLFMNLTVLSPQESGAASLYLLRFIAYGSSAFFISFFSKIQKVLLIKALVVSVAITVGIGFLQFFYYPNLRNLYYLEWDDHLYRLFSVFLDPNFASVIFSCLFLFLLGTAIENIRKERKKGILIGVLSLVPVIAIFLTYSRTGMITLTVGTVALLLVKGYRKLLLVCLSVFVLILFFTADLKVEGLNPLRTVSTNARLESARIALTIFSKNPLFGVGFNAYRFAQHRYGFRPDDRWKTSHADAGTDNSFLFVLATTGIVGIVCYLYFWYTILKIAYVLSVNGKIRLPTVVFATGIALLVSSFFLNTLFYPFILFWIMSLYAVMGKKSP